MDSEIILIGNELLIGKIRDTNGEWIIKKMLEYGLRISRITTIPDDVDIISCTIKDSLSRNPIFIFTSGGLGPTYDDMTYEGIAKAFNVPLKMNNVVVGYLKERYQQLKKLGITEYTDLNDSRLKMAFVPEGCEILKNPKGAAPGIIMKRLNDGFVTSLIAFPGFPDELKGLFETYVYPLLEEAKQDFESTGIIYEGKFGESSIADEIKRIRELHPEIWIKTAPSKTKRNGNNVWMDIHLTAFVESKEEKEINRIKKILIESRKEIENIIIKLNGKILEKY